MSLLIRGVNGLVERLLAPFHTQASSRQVGGVVEACRAVLGLLLMHQAADILGFVSLLGPAADPYGRMTVCILLAAAAFTFGVCTPVAAAVLLYHFGTGSYSGGSLGDMVTTLVLWGLLLCGAGRHFSVDALAARWVPAYRRVLYGWQVDPGSKRGLAWVRFSLLTLFWGICVVAMVYHLFDSFWWSARVLPVSLTSPYLSYHHRIFATLRDGSPVLFHRFCAAALIIQVVWELFLLPLMYFRIGRWFVLIQGVLFFLASLLFLNLQYLPLAEMVLWALVFGTGWRLAPVGETRAEPVPWLAGGFACWSAALAVVHAVMLWPYDLERTISPKLSESYKSVQSVFRFFGLRPVCVFNHTDMQVSRAWFVLSETDEGGRPLRVVPYVDLEGGRLRYLRNDLLYFAYSLRWQRVPIQGRFEGGDLRFPKPFTLDLARRIAQLDARVEPGSGCRHYRIDVFHRELVEDVHPPYWTGPVHAHTCRFHLDAEETAAGGWPAFDLPPGHWGDRRQEARTHERLSNLEPAPPEIVSRQPVVEK